MRRMSLEGKAVFITGAARGIGAAVATAAASRGARVSLAGLEPDALADRARQIGTDTPYFECDVTDSDSIAAAVDGTVDALGGIDIVLANAGIATYGPVMVGDAEAWLKTIDINLNGSFRTVHATLPHVLERRGYISVVASIASFVPLAGMSSYCASKAGVEAFVRTLRQEVGFRGVDVGLVHPSWIDTDLTREAEHDLASFKEARSRMPWPVKSTTSVEKCANAIVDGFEKRRSRVFVPRSAGLMYWLRSLITSDVSDRRFSKEAAELIPQMEAEVAALGRSGSSRTASINDLPSDQPAEIPTGAK